MQGRRPPAYAAMAASYYRCARPFGRYDWTGLLHKILPDCQLAVEDLLKLLLNARDPLHYA